MKLPKVLIGGFRPLPRAVLPVNRELVSRQLRTAAQMPPNSIKPLRSPQPRHLDFDNLPIG